MKKFILLSLLFFSLMQEKAFSQQLHHEKIWSHVDSLEKQGLYRSAWDKVREIYTLAVQDHNDQQQIKALIYELKYRNYIEEDAGITDLKEVDSLMQQASGIKKAILQSMLAEMYWRYVQSHRFSLYNRITSLSEKEADITTWSLNHFYEKISSLYQASLQDESALKKVELKSLSVIIDTGKNTLDLQPTLFDLLAHRALEYFTGEEQNVIRPAQHFIIHKAAYFDPALTFSRIPLPDNDTTDLAYKALKLYQKLIRFHLQDDHPAALIDVDLQRLQFVYRKAVLPGKDSLYRMALEHIVHQYGNTPAGWQAVYLLAQWHYQQGSQYDPISHPQGKDELKKALELCNTIPPLPVTFASISAQQLKDNILRKAISLQAEQVNIPGKPFRVLVTYKNLSNLWFRLVELPGDAQSVFLNRLPTKDYLLQQKALKSWMQKFPNPGDHQNHAAEMKVDALPPGRYALLVSGNESFSEGKSPSESIVFYVSSISYIQNGQGEYLLLDRETGEALTNATVHLWHTRYNQNKRKNELTLYGIYNTGNDGSFHIKPDKDHRNLMPEVSWKDDHLFTAQSQWIPYVNSDETDKDTIVQKTYLFTDRSIYRPGQTVHFKGIALNYERYNHKAKVIKDKKVIIHLIDGNNQKIDSLQLVSDDFGSYAGTFILPKGLLNGYWHLEADNNQATAYFSVEDYKRPTFYLKWDTASHEYRLGDTVTIRGSVLAYSQAVIDGATVKYQVTRRTRAVFPWYRRSFRMIYPPRQEIASIAQGITTTDDKGNFNIQFTAIPDEETDSALHPVFDYIVSVDVTDINGESHSFTYELPLGYQSLELALNINDKASIDALDTIQVTSTTLTGKFVAAPVTIHLYPVKAPERYIRSRYWRQPDEYIMNKAEYLQYFPHDEYKNELDPETWKKGDSVLTMEDTTNKNGIIPLHHRKIEPGWYALEVSAKDKYGRQVKVTNYIQLYDEQMKKPPFANPLWISKNEIEAQPGDKVSWLVAADGQATIYTQDEGLEKIRDIKSESLNTSVIKTELPITEADRGGIIRHYVTVRYNRLFTDNVRINVPWKNKQLHIQNETFRDKLLPGAKEQWKMKITGDDGQKVSAELLASMYDASLDAFRPHDWTLPDIYPVNYGKVNWNDGINFRQVSSYMIFNPKQPTYPTYIKRYPSLNWFGYHRYERMFHYADEQPVALRGRVAGIVPEAKSLSNERKANLTASVTVINEKTTDTSNWQVDQQQMLAITTRKNFNETAFFFPQLHTDDSGNVVFSFIMPEALTKWKLMMFAHTRDMRYAFSEKETVTQKPLMIQANAPRFVRQGDQLVFSAKVSNLSKENLQGNAQLELTDLIAGKEVNNLFKNKNTTQKFKVDAGQSAVVKWSINVPENYTGALSYKITAAAGNFNDGERNALPVLTNRILVTESLPLHFKGNGKHDLNFPAIKQMDQSKTLQPQGITIEYTGNPIWYAVQTLPFLDEPKQQSADAYFNQLYANALSGFIAERIPHFNETMQQWLTKDTNALKSPLQKNENLKSVLLQETPWVEAAQKESAQKAKVANWFNDKESTARMAVAVNKLKDMQLSNGGFSWFKDMPDDRYITQRIISGIGHLIKLDAMPKEQLAALQSIVQKGVPYLDARIKESYQKLMKQKVKKPSINPTDIQYLYMRSFFPDIRMEDSVKAAYDFYKKLTSENWVDQSVYLQAMIALAMDRSGDKETAHSILKSLSETAIKDPVKGMHWKKSPTFYRWYQAPVEAQAVCIEAFDEINHDEKTVDDLRNWLLAQKQTQYWPTTAATADAVYALLLTGAQWLTTSPEVTIKLGNKDLSFGNQSSESGTQYDQMHISGNEISPAMGNVNVKISDAKMNQPSWGAIYFQYFENMDKIRKAGNELSISREIALEKTTPEGPKLIPVTKETYLHVGDKVQVRLVVKVNQDLDYVHLKDVRASCMEPLQTISSYHWRGGVGYYTTVTDAAMHYYFPHLSRGTYVFTYPVYVTHAGDYTGGMSTLECLYAPSIRAHSEGVNVEVGSTVNTKR